MSTINVNIPAGFDCCGAGCPPDSSALTMVFSGMGMCPSSPDLNGTYTVPNVSAGKWEYNHTFGDGSKVNILIFCSGGKFTFASQIPNFDILMTWTDQFLATNYVFTLPYQSMITAANPLSIANGVDSQIVCPLDPDVISPVGGNVSISW